jgi:serine-type D-Ala-D-Ala carboxypeptidase (penicillin-binding protein 5/6)
VEVFVKHFVRTDYRLHRLNVLWLFVVLIPFLPFYVSASEITADAYLLVEKDSFSIIKGKDYHRPLPPASTTKVMTTILALENLHEQQDIVPTNKVLSIPASKLSLCPGKTYKAIDLINGTMIESANDAAYSLAVSVAGSEELFADMMNAKSREIGALDTHFVNASGLPAQSHYSSAYDLALMLRYALQNKRFQEVVGTKYFSFNRGDAEIRYRNHNRLLHCFTPSIGGKTGFTRAAKHCYVGAFEKDGKTYIVSMLGSRNLWGDAVSILGEIFTDKDLPSQQEIARARGNQIVLASYKTVKVEADEKPTKKLKKTKDVKKKSKKGKKGKHRTRRAP